MDNLIQYRFKPGQSGNPGGRLTDPALRKLQKEIRARRPLIIKTLVDCLRAKSRRVRIEAMKLALAYGFGKPPESVWQPETATQMLEGQFTEAELVAMRPKRGLSPKAR